MSVAPHPDRERRPTTDRQLTAEPFFIETRSGVQLDVEMPSGRDEQPFLEPGLAAEVAVLLGAQPVGEAARRQLDVVVGERPRPSAMSRRSRQPSTSPSGR